MTEPAAVGMHAARKAEIKQGESVVIIGCGTIGLITAQIVRAMGASKIFLVDVSEERLDIARSMGFPNVYNSKKNLAETLGACADVVIEMVGLSVTYNLALDLAKGCGRVVWTGNIADDLVVPKQRVSSILRKELSILGTWNSTAIGSEPTDWQMVLQLQSQGKIKLTSLISHQILLDELPDMIQRMVKEKDLAGSKIIVNMD
jgi:L-iditol 2-dehydrogenase